MSVVQCSIYPSHGSASIFRTWLEANCPEPPRKVEIIMLFAALVERLRIWRRERETLTELKRLSSRDLFDIGINPADIRSIAREAARS